MKTGQAIAGLLIMVIMAGGLFMFPNYAAVEGASDHQTCHSPLPF
ncbi:hypothetical protein ACFLU3_00175 [Chloroflexota bacterium]